MKVFIIHYKKLVERKIHIIKQMKKYNIIDYEFIEIDRDELNNENTSIFEDNYSNAQQAITLSHLYAYQQAQKYEISLILEDDVILAPNFLEKLYNYFQQLPADFDMLFIGDGCNHHIHPNKLIPNKYIYKRFLKEGEEFATRCTDSYIISKNCATTLCNYVNDLPKKINLAIDCWLNIPCEEMDLNIYWAEPTIVTQGTQNGLFEPSHN